MNASDTEPLHPSTMPDSLPPAPEPELLPEPEPPLPPASPAAVEVTHAPATGAAAAPAVAAPVAGGTFDLYRAALGPLNVNWYLAAFARFDANGHAGPVWNPAAALGTVGWMLFRRLWVEALVYVVLLLGLVVVLGWALRSELLTSDHFWPAAAAMLLGAMALPGWLGTAWLHADIRSKLLKAAASAPTLHETRDTLSSNGVDPRRQRVFVLASLTLLVLAVGMAVLLQPMQSPSLRAATGAVGPTLSLVSKAPQVDGDTARLSPVPPEAAVPAPVPEPLAISLPTAADALPARPSAAEGRAAPATGAEAPEQPPQPAQAPQPPQTPQPAQPPQPMQPMQPAQPPQPAPVPQPAQLPQPAQRTQPAERSPKAAVSAAVPSAPPSASTAAATGLAPAARAEPAGAAVAKKGAVPAAPLPVLQQAPAKGGFAINVGLYAVPANADRAVARLQEVGLPTERDEVPSARGPLSRVRVGPFDEPASAEQTAVQIRSLGLEAQVFMRCAHPARRSADARCRPTPADSGPPDSRAGG